MNAMKESFCAMMRVLSVISCWIMSQNTHRSL